MEDINNRIKNFLKMKGITLVDLAEMMNTSQANVSRILSKNDMLLSTLRKISDCLGVSPDYFLRESDDSFIPSKKDLEDMIDKRISKAFEERG